MKIIYQNKKRVSLFTISDIARALNKSPHTLWTQVRKYLTFPAPTVRIGNRDYYSEQEFKELTTKEGV